MVCVSPALSVTIQRNKMKMLKKKKKRKHFEITSLDELVKYFASQAHLSLQTMVLTPTLVYLLIGIC